MVIPKKLQQLRAFLVLHYIVSGLELVYLGEYFQNEEAKGLKGWAKNSSTSASKYKTCHVQSGQKLAGIQWRALVNYPEGCSQGSDKGEKRRKEFWKKPKWEQERRNKPNRKPRERA